MKTMDINISLQQNKNISNDLKEQISNLTFLNDGVTHTLKFNKDIPYTDENDNKTIY